MPLFHYSSGNNSRSRSDGNEWDPNRHFRQLLGEAAWRKDTVKNFIPLWINILRSILRMGVKWINIHMGNLGPLCEVEISWIDYFCHHIGRKFITSIFSFTICLSRVFKVLYSKVFCNFTIEFKRMDSFLNLTL